MDGLLSDVQAKSDLITSLNAQVDTLKGENATLEVAVNDSQEKLQGFEVLDVVAKVQSESKHTVGKEHIENLKRRASRWLGCTDESEKEDIYADMATYCKANGVELGKGDLGKGSRPDEPVELTEQEKINKRADEIIASDKTISFGKAVIMAVKEMETK